MYMYLVLEGRRLVGARLLEMRARASSYTPPLTRLLLHAYSCTPTLTRLLLHACSYTPALTRLLLHACSCTPTLHACSSTPHPVAQASCVRLSSLTSY
jgi:hypothetical protein